MPQEEQLLRLSLGVTELEFNSKLQFICCLKFKPSERGGAKRVSAPGAAQLPAGHAEDQKDVDRSEADQKQGNQLEPMEEDGGEFVCGPARG